MNQPIPKPLNPIGHEDAVRRAIRKGWTGDGSTGCLCANREIKCPEHSSG